MTISRLSSNSLMPTKTIPWGNFSNTPTGTYTEGDGASYKYVTFTASGTLTVTDAGYMEVLLVGGGAGQATSQSYGGGGPVVQAIRYVPSGSVTVTVGAGGTTASVVPDQRGNSSIFGTATDNANALYTGWAQESRGAGCVPGSSYNTTGWKQGVISSITGSAIEYGRAGAASPVQNRGDSGATGNGMNGVVIVRVRTN